MKKLFKVLNENMESPYCGFNYEVSKWYTCKDFDDDPKKDCTYGFYAVDVEGLPYVYRLGRQIWWCEVDGKGVEYDIYNRRYEKIKLTHRVNLDEVKQMAVSREQKCGYKLSEILFPFNPLNVFTEEEATESIVTPLTLEKLKEWSSVRNLVRASVLDLVRPSVWPLVRDFISDSVSDTARDSVLDSVLDIYHVYISSLYLNIETWKGYEPSVNLFQSGIDLWRSGFVPSYDGEKWLLHAGPKAKIVWREVIE